MFWRLTNTIGPEIREIELNCNAAGKILGPKFLPPRRPLIRARPGPRNSPSELKNKKSFQFPQILITFEFFVDVASINFLSKVNATSRQYKTLPDYLCHCKA